MSQFFFKTGMLNTVVFFCYLSIVQSIQFVNEMVCVFIYFLVKNKIYIILLVKNVFQTLQHILILLMLH